MKRAQVAAFRIWCQFMSMRKGLLLLLVAIFATVMIAYLGLARIEHRGLVYLSLVYLAAPAAAFAMLVLLYASRRSPSLIAPTIKWLSSIGFVSLILWASVPLGRVIQKMEVKKAKDYPVRVNSLLESYKSERGKYPKSLSEVAQLPKIPRLLKAKWEGYQLPENDLSETGVYYFRFKDPAGPLQWSYSSSNRLWTSSGD
jgi:hypothetical protein